MVVMPSHHIKRRMQLMALEELTPQLIHHIPRHIVRVLIRRYRVQKVPRVSQPIRAQRPQLRQFEITPPDLEDVSTCLALDVHLEPLPALDDTDLAGLDV